VNFFFFVILFLVSLPGTLLNAPVGNANAPLLRCCCCLRRDTNEDWGGRVTGYIIKEKANKKAREAVRSSTVKIRGNDVIASVKVRACSTHACRSVDLFIYYLTSSRLTSWSDVCDTQVLTALWMVPLTYTIYATLAGLYTGSFLVAVAVWLVLPFFSYIRYPAHCSLFVLLCAWP
jgi:hypothetical protein